MLTAVYISSSAAHTNKVMFSRLDALSSSLKQHIISLHFVLRCERSLGTRYTIRAKRGGSQSSYDSGGRKAQSAGVSLRRYGELALREDVSALLKEWEGPLKVRRDHCRN